MDGSGDEVLKLVLGVTSGNGSGRLVVSKLGCLLGINTSVPLLHSRL